MLAVVMADSFTCAAWARADLLAIEEQTSYRALDDVIASTASSGDRGRG